MKEKLKILHIVPNNIKNSPNVLNDIDKIIWNYKLSFDKMGHDFHINTFLDNDTKYDIVHLHKENVSKTLNRYIYSLHDNNDNFLNDRINMLYNEISDTVKKSIISLCHSQYIIDVFNLTDKIFFLENGVNTEIYKNYNNNKKEHKLLCIGKNIIKDNQIEDNKNFKLSIEIAKMLNLPITIVSDIKNNNIFFTKYKNLLEYDKLTIINDPNEKMLVDIYNEHTILLNLSNLEFNHPNLSTLESLSCGLPVISSYSGKMDIEGIIKCDLDKNDIYNKILHIINNYDIYKVKSIESSKRFDWNIVTKKLEQIYYNVKNIHINIDSNEMVRKMVDSYNNTEIVHQEPLLPKSNFFINFHDGPMIEINSPSDNGEKYKIEFVDIDKNDIIYTTELSNNQWAKSNRKWYTNWVINITNKLTGEINKAIFDPLYKNFLIKIKTDNEEHLLKWMDTVNKFRIKYNCKIYCLIENNYNKDKMIKKYKEITYIDNINNYSNIYAIYEIGYNDNLNINPNGNTGVRIANDILKID